MDTDSLTDDAYAIIVRARSVSALLGAELAVSGKRAKSEHEFLQYMLETFADVRDHDEIADYIDDENDSPVSLLELEKTIRQLEADARSLLAK